MTNGKRYRRIKREIKGKNAEAGDRKYKKSNSSPIFRNLGNATELDEQREEGVKVGIKRKRRRRKWKGGVGEWGKYSGEAAGGRKTRRNNK